MEYKKHSFLEIKKACSNITENDFKTVKKTHEFMQSNSGDSTKSHQLNTAFILAENGFDASTVSAALVHEVLFENAEKKNEMKNTLGEEITEIAEEIATLKSVKNKNYGKMPLSRLSKVLIGISKDFRSLFVELASQLDKMRNIKNRKKNKRKPLAELVKEVYAPIAHKLGLYEMEWELRDLALKYFQPREYEKIKKLVGKKREEREKTVEKARKKVEKILEKENIQGSVYGRAKSFNGIYKKMNEQGKKFKEINDLYGIRIICDSVAECYRLMGLIHKNFPPIGEYDDYIAKPKENNYQSIHTMVDFNGKKIETQIRTWEMHRNAEEGLAAHWRYKQVEKDKDFDQRLSWAKQLVEWQRKLKKSNQRMQSLKMGFGGREIYALTPKKEIITLPEGATALDFAYGVHSDLGNKCKSVTINGKISSLSKKLESGNVVKVNVGKKMQCKRSWLNIVKTDKAKKRIRQYVGIKGPGKKKTKKKSKKTTSSLKKTRIAKCCNPLPGEKITGYKTTKRKITIHSRECPFLEPLPNKRKIDLEWGEEKRNDYPSKIKVKAIERAGILIDLLNELEKQGLTIKGTKTKSEKDNTIKCVFDLQLKNAEQFKKTKNSLLSIPSVLEVGR